MSRFIFTHFEVLSSKAYTSHEHSRPFAPAQLEGRVLRGLRGAMPSTTTAPETHTVYQGINYPLKGGLGPGSDGLPSRIATTGRAGKLPQTLSCDKVESGHLAEEQQEVGKPHPPGPRPAGRLKTDPGPGQQSPAPTQPGPHSCRGTAITGGGRHMSGPLMGWAHGLLETEGRARTLHPEPSPQAPGTESPSRRNLNKYLEDHQKNKDLQIQVNI
ncbi:uncharacterized protein LOC115291418 isoform X1 [Suricata suricatta]|uniref:uncharacterized protein LOC115291418 isoform X1 n=1 Tax=Suricata suricatta TaxID=37032 RepID=UPI001155B2C2|nr:uncharacterized protein LOC115291418 isoform X1 [Suricata suricatta]XP_029794729.1 uncharacterized protein LOC115291418 isoform X1 [Suricata suricatta]